MRSLQWKCIALVMASCFGVAAQAESILLSGVLLQKVEGGKPYPGLLVSAHAGVNCKSDSVVRFQMAFDAQQQEQEGNLLVNYPEGWKVMGQFSAGFNNCRRNVSINLRQRNRIN
jgi:hypothetical protein